MYDRLLKPNPNRTFFLWGPRQTGKSTWLRALFPDGLWIDLLEVDAFRAYVQNPSLLRERLSSMGSVPWVIIDEIQKVPALLDEVHGLIESRKIRFALSGSSARKVKRGHANLLGGRALRYEMHGLCAVEIGDAFDLVRALNHGYLPSHYLDPQYRALLRSYVGDYLKEEIAAEGLVRNLPGFSQFLDVAALSDAESINFSTIARDCAVSSPTIKSYFEILVDTLLGRWLPAYTKRFKRKVAQSPKFYFFDVGVVNHLAKRGVLEPGTESFGKAFENWIFHELTCHNMYSDAYEELSYWRLASGAEVDFIVGDMRIAVEAKASSRIHSDHLKGLRTLLEDYPNVKHRIVVCLEPQPRKTEDGILILPWKDFVQQLHAGCFF